jgi:type IV secretory pathway TraG/TraD family ATPase VirD4
MNLNITFPAQRLGLGAARDKGVHIIMAHQSVKDLYDCPADLEGDAVAGSVIENCKFMLVYRLRDPDTADWVARMTGSILVDDEMRKVKTDISLTEKMETDRMIRQAERYYIDSNMLLNLPKFVGFVFTRMIWRRRPNFFTYRRKSNISTCFHLSIKIRCIPKKTIRFTNLPLTCEAANAYS